jgi:membrane associated rhomboid family serine protease
VLANDKFVYKLVPGYCSLSLEGLEKGYVWQLITYQFMHANFLHIFFNCWVIYVFGRELEIVLGARRYLTLVFTSGIVGGIFQIITHILLPGRFHGEVLGASACAFGLVSAFAALFPEEELSVQVFLVFPVTVTARVLLGVSAAVAVVGIIFPMDHVANAAHVGGMVMGWVLVRYIYRCSRRKAEDGKSDY